MKETGTCLLRAAVPADGAALLEIYAPYVQKTAITFEYTVPSLTEFQSRIAHTLTRYPYLVAERDGVLLGYAYTGAFVGRPAYDWSAETTIYLRENQRKQGLGKLLYEALEGVSRAQNITNLNACIGYPEREDAYLTANSVAFHTHLGYTMVGKFHQCGYKFGTWYHMVWMEKLIGVHQAQPQPVIPFPSLPETVLTDLGISPFPPKTP